MIEYMIKMLKWFNFSYFMNVNKWRNGFFFFMYFINYVLILFVVFFSSFNWKCVVYVFCKWYFKIYIYYIVLYKLWIEN